MPRNLVEVDTSEPEAVAPDRPGIVERLMDALDRLDETFPLLSSWAGGRLDIEVPAIAASLAAHLALILGLAMVGYAVRTEAAHRFEATAGLVDTSLPDLDKMQFQDLDQTDKRPTLEPASGSFSPNLATMITTGAPSSPRAAASDVKSTPAEIARLDIERASLAVVPTATMLGKTVEIKGNGAEHVGRPEGAVDRIAQEILRRLEKGRTLVVWVFDASGSLQAERERLAKHIGTVYTHIAQLDERKLAEGGGLLTAVIAFGQDRKAMTDAPTDDAEEIVRAIRAVALDESGIESTFQTVTEVVHRWGRYRDAKGNVYRAMVIVVTDEAGDDEVNLEDAIATANKAKTPVYVLGSQALFGRKDGRMNYTDPKTGRTHFNVAVTQGPESAMLEQIRLPFWYGGNQFDMLDSGFGPYALSRLAGATGGIFFVTRMGGARMGGDPAAMREYKPDWVDRKQYEATVLGRPIRKAVIEAALLTQQNLPGMPTLLFPPVDSEEFKKVMEQNQAVSAQTEYTVDAALEPISAVAKLRDRETSRRWQAHYDLIRGRLLATKVRCREYNWICARLKTEPPKFARSESNAWRLMPDTEIHYSDKAAAAGQQAVDLLKRVVGEHPNTPWALLAKRELENPLGFKWVETYVRPIARDNNAENAAAKKAVNNNAMSKPPPPPKL